MIFFIQNTQAWNENQVPNRLLTLKKILIPVAHDESNYYANPFTAAGGSLTITGSGTIRFIQAIFYSDMVRGLSVTTVPTVTFFLLNLLCVLEDV
jgi:hypothetical protein